jgi:multimeric flavodoxin WrbA
VKITAIVGSYHKGGIIDSAVDEILAVARQCGADVEKVYLLDLRIEFCRNCQECVQTGEGLRGDCQIKDDMSSILDRIDASEGLILASPTNFGTVTALMKRFIERLICYGYWPWDVPAPKHRIRQKPKRAIVVASSAAPGLMGRYLTGIVKLLRNAAKLLGAGRVEVLFIGLARHTPNSSLSSRAAARARKLAVRLVG